MNTILANPNEENEGCPNSNLCAYLKKEFKTRKMIQTQVAIHTIDYCRHPIKYESCPAYNRGKA